MNSSERKILRDGMPWLKRSRPPLVFFVQLAVSLTLLAVMTIAFCRARSAASLIVSPMENAPSPTDAHVALVQLPEFVEKVAMQSLRTFLSTFRDGGTNDIDFVDFDEAPPPFDFSVPEINYRGSVEVVLPKYAADNARILPALKISGGEAGAFPPVPSGVFADLDDSLKAAGFKFKPPSSEQYSVASGSAVFYVDFAGDTAPEVYVLSPASPDTRIIESALLKSVAAGPCKGTITVMWN